MRKSTLRSTTSLFVSVSLIAQPVLAQEAPTEDIAPELCAGLVTDGVAPDPAAEPRLPCLDSDGTVINDQATLDAAITAQTATDTVTEETTETADETAAVVADVPAENTDVSDADETPPDEATATVADDLPEGGETAATVSDGQPGDTNSAAVVADDLPEGGESAATVAEGLPEGDEDADAVVSEGLPEGDTTDVTVTKGPDAGDEIVSIDDSAPEEATVDTQTPSAAVAAAAATTGDPAAEITVEDVTDADIRSSDEDFSTAITGETETITADDGSGLSSFERALLVGLGALVVGSVLDNGDEVVSNSGDRVVVRRDNDLIVLKDDDVLLRQPGSQVETQSFADGSTRTIVTREDGTRINTIRATDGRVLRRTRILADGREIVLFDDTQQTTAIDVTALPSVDGAGVQTQVSGEDVETLRQALLANRNADLDRRFSLQQIRNIREVRMLAPEVELDTVTFASGSAAIAPDQAEELVNLGVAISNIIADDPGQIFLIEGHTDAVGDASYNLALSDRRAETVALALTEYFEVPPENLITQGYGETILKVQTTGPERANRRASLRNITQLLR